MLQIYVFFFNTQKKSYLCKFKRVSFNPRYCQLMTKKILPLLALLLLFAACTKDTDSGNTSTTEEEHVYDHCCFAIKVNIDQMGSSYLNLLTQSELGAKIYLGDECLVRLDTVSLMINHQRCFVDTIVFNALPYYQSLTMRYTLPSNLEPESIPCGVYLVVSGQGWKVDKNGKRYDDFAPNARVLGKTYTSIGDNFIDQLRQDLDAFNVAGHWVEVE